MILSVIILNASLYSEATYNWRTKQFTEEKNGLVFPGTKWCGIGNNAMSFDDLGK
jgi:hypothetical protein